MTRHNKCCLFHTQNTCTCIASYHVIKNRDKTFISLQNGTIRTVIKIILSPIRYHFKSASFCRRAAGHYCTMLFTKDASICNNLETVYNWAYKPFMTGTSCVQLGLQTLHEWHNMCTTGLTNPLWLAQHVYNWAYKPFMSGTTCVQLGLQTLHDWHNMCTTGHRAT